MKVRQQGTNPRRTFDGVLPESPLSSDNVAVLPEGEQRERRVPTRFTVECAPRLRDTTSARRSSPRTPEQLAVSRYNLAPISTLSSTGKRSRVAKVKTSLGEVVQEAMKALGLRVEVHVFQPNGLTIINGRQTKRSRHEEERLQEDVATDLVAWADTSVVSNRKVQALLTRLRRQNVAPLPLPHHMSRARSAIESHVGIPLHQVGTDTDNAYMLPHDVLQYALREGMVKPGEEVTVTFSGDGHRYGKQSAVQVCMRVGQLVQRAQALGWPKSMGCICIGFYRGDETEEALGKFLPSILDDLRMVEKDGLRSTDEHGRVAKTHVKVVVCADLKFSNMIFSHTSPTSRTGCLLCTANIQWGSSNNLWVPPSKQAEYARTDRERSGPGCHDHCRDGDKCDGDRKHGSCQALCSVGCDGTHGVKETPLTGALSINWFVFDVLHCKLRCTEKYFAAARELMGAAARQLKRTGYLNSALKQWAKKHGLPPGKLKTTAKAARFFGDQANAVLTGFPDLVERFREKVVKNNSEAEVYYTRLCTLRDVIGLFVSVLNRMSGYGREAEMPTVDYLSQLQKDSLDLEAKFVHDFGWDNEVAYVHYMARHGVDMMRVHGYLGQYSCEAVEQKNQLLQRWRQMQQVRDAAKQSLQHQQRELYHLAHEEVAPPAKRAYTTPSRIANTSEKPSGGFYKGARFT